MKRYDRLIEKRFKEWELRHLGNAALPGLASHLGLADRYGPDEAEASAALTIADCIAEEAQRLGPAPVPTAYLRSLPHLPGNPFLEG